MGYTQQSNPASSYLGYDLFSGGGGGNMGSDLAHPNYPFWMMQWLNGQDRVAGSAIDNNMLRNWVFLLNSMQSANYPAYRPIAPWANFASWNAAPPPSLLQHQPVSAGQLMVARIRNA